MTHHDDIYYVWVVYDHAAKSYISTHRGRSSWATRGNAMRAIRSLIYGWNTLDRFEPRKALVTVLPA